MSADIERDDTYVAQLYQVFKSCDVFGTGLLGNDELFQLCMRLQLDDQQTNFIITNLIGNDLIAKINFDDFKEIFVSLLTQSQNECEELQQFLPNCNDCKDSNKLSSVSQPNSNSFQNSYNTEEYLRGIWNRLGVGKNGYLNFDELYRVCEHIGMIGINNDIIEQLFDKLDYDQDGKVSFDEFLEGLFQHDTGVYDNNVNNVNFMPQLQQESPHIQSSNGDISSLTHCNHLNDSDRNISENDDALMREHNSSFYTNMSSYLITLDPDRSGYTEAENVLKLWDSLGFTNSEQILMRLGFNPKLKVNIQDLSALLEEKLCASNNSNPELFQISLATFQNELTQIKINYEQVKDERDRLRVNLSEANARADLLAQEVDDHHTKLEQSSQSKLSLLEKKYNEQIRLLEDELQKEKETMDSQSFHLRQDIAKELSTVQEQSAKMRENMIVMEQENKRLENEVQSLNRKHCELQKAFMDLNKQVEETIGLKKKLAEIESMQGLVREQQYQSLMDEIDSLKGQNKELQDQNDELLLEIENMRQQMVVQSPNSKIHKKPTHHRRSNSWLSDYMESVQSVSTSSDQLQNNNNIQCVTHKLKRRGNGSSSSSEETSEDECCAVGRSKRIVLSAKTHMDLDCAQEMTEGEEQSMNDTVSEGVLLREIDQLKHQLTAQIGQTDQLINDRNKTVLQIQQFYEKALHHKEANLKEQMQLNSNLNAAYKGLEAKLLDERNGLKQTLHKHFNEILFEFTNSSISFAFINEMENSLYQQIRNAFSTTIYNLMIEFVLEAEQDEYQVKQNKETQIQRLNHQLIEAFTRFKDRLVVTHSNAYKQIADERAEDHSLSHSYRDLMQGSTHEKKVMTGPNHPIDSFSALTKLYSQNTQLLKELHLNAEKNRKFEKENSRLHYKCQVLSKLLKEITNGSQ